MSLNKKRNQMLERYEETGHLPRVKEPKIGRSYNPTTKRNDVIAKLRAHFELVDQLTIKPLFKC